MSQNNIRLICKASNTGGRSYATAARIAYGGIIWTSPIPNDSSECNYINQCIDEMIGADVKSENTQFLTE